MRVAVVDIGTNSTRLLVADVDGSGHVTELERRTTITRLGQGVDASGRLSDEAIGRVTAALDAYRAAIDRHGAERTVAVLTSAPRRRSSPSLARRASATAAATLDPSWSSTSEAARRSSSSAAAAR